MKEAENQAKKIGIEILYLEVFSSNSRAHHVYEKLGYRETGIIPKGAKRNGEYIDMIQMVKEI
jgi:RimJ/RimL family protein N-acetyltransferase